METKQLQDISLAAHGIPELEALTHGDSGEERVAWLMSMALDDCLDHDDAAEFERMIGSDPALENLWQTWQAVDLKFRSVAPVSPPPGFAAGFEHRLQRVERRRQLRLGLLIGVISVALWGSIFVGAVSLAAFAVYNQPVWSGEVVRNMALWWAAALSWVDSVTSTFWAVWSTPQAKGLGIGYVVLAVLVLVSWTQWLRRSTQNEDSLSTV